MPQRITDYRELLDKEKGVDAVIIATPDHWHVPICQAAVFMLGACYCESCWPRVSRIGKTGDEPSEVGDSDRQSRLLHRSYRRSFEVIQSGLLGNVTEIHVRHPSHAWPEWCPAAHRPSDPVPEIFDCKFLVELCAPTRPVCQRHLSPREVPRLVRLRRRFDGRFLLPWFSNSVNLCA